MRCHICDAPLSSINFNKDHGDIDPCSTCLEIIHNVFTDPVPEEDLRDAAEEPTIEELNSIVEETYYGDWSER